MYHPPPKSPSREGDFYFILLANLMHISLLLAYDSLYTHPMQHNRSYSIKTVKGHTFGTALTDL